MKAIRHIISFLILSCLTLILASCGGGSSGTGAPDSFSSAVIEGIVVDEVSQPIEGARVTVIETGDATETDVGGRFQLNVMEETDSVNLMVETDGISGNVAVSPIAEEGTRADVTIAVNRRTQVVGARNVEVLAKIVGACDFAFENKAVIRQGNRLRDGTECPVRVTVRSDGRGLSGIPFRIESSRCDRVRWTLEEEGLTGTDGTGTLTFQFQDSDRFCQYRIVAPYHVEGLNDTIFPVETFRKQAFDRGQ